MTLAALWDSTNRLAGLRRFAVAITVLNVLGHTVLGFEQSWLQPIVALLVAYGMEFLLESVDAAVNRRAPRYRGGPVTIIDFFLSAHISGLAVAMLLYANDRLWPIALGAAIAIGSKAIFRATIGGRSRHFFNPSNLGITAVLLLFPWVGIAQPYHFTENLSGAWNWVLPAIIVASGTFLNARYTKRLPLLLSWVALFLLQGVLRWWVTGTPLGAALLPMTGVAFVLFTFYMVTDPATTPAGWRAQVLFGGAVGALYGLLVAVHVVFGFFFALTIVTGARGAWAWAATAAAAVRADRAARGTALVLEEARA